MADDPSTRQDQTYSLAARRFHWWTAAFVTVQVPVGLYMAYRGNVLGIFDGTTNFLYSSHKTVGLVIFALVVWRLLYRLVRGAPHPEPTITPWQRTASKLNHWALYSLLLVVPILGYTGISLFPALDLFGLVALPGIVPVGEDEAARKAANDAAARVFYYHWLAAILLLGLIALHVAAALFHYLVRKDGVLARMLPSVGRTD